MSFALLCAAGFEVIYEGIEREHSCDQLQPGHTYRVRVSCCSKGGRSDVSKTTYNTKHQVPSLVAGCQLVFCVI